MPQRHNKHLAGHREHFSVRERELVVEEQGRAALRLRMVNTYQLMGAVTRTWRDLKANHCAEIRT